ncbi:MAG: response regulator [Bacteroidetes bacterium]|nr:response regulator [Bacteroidota bacterium]
MKKGVPFPLNYPLKKSNLKTLKGIQNKEKSLEGSMKGIKILLAEDNRVNQLFASELISEWGAELDIADNGRIAIELYQKNHYDIILMDIQMPVLDGIDATQFIRNQFSDDKKNIPIIAITANAKNGDELKFKELGMNEAIFKPYSSIQLFKLIKKYLHPNKVVQPRKSIEVKNEINPEEHLLLKHASLHVLKSFSRGKESFIVKMLDAIIDTVPPTIKELNNAIQNRDWISVNKFSHKLIPNMNMSGNSYLESEMKWIENHATLADNQQEILKKWPAIKLEVEKTMNELKKADTYYKSRTFGK